ncbi:hypothetical protein ES703_11247 [subsurface metagenome]
MGAVYEDPLWEDLDKNLDSLILSLSEETEKEEEETAVAEEVAVVEIFREAPNDKVFYGRCPGCNRQFDYDEGDVGRTVRCRQCNAPMKLVRTGKEEAT